MIAEIERMMANDFLRKLNMHFLCEEHPLPGNTVLLAWGDNYFTAERVVNDEEESDELFCIDKNNGMKFTINLGVPFINMALRWRYIKED